MKKNLTEPTIFAGKINPSDIEEIGRIDTNSQVSIHSEKDVNKQELSCREAFENWAKRQYLYFSAPSEYGAYSDKQTNDGWVAWQAAYNTRTTPLQDDKGVGELVGEIDKILKKHGYDFDITKRSYQELLSEIAALTSAPKNDQLIEYYKKSEQFIEENFKGIFNEEFQQTLYTTQEMLIFELHRKLGEALKLNKG